MNIVPKYKFKKILTSFLALIILSYFGFHAVYGDRGVISYLNLNRQLESSWNLLYKLRIQKLELEHRVNLLRPHSLDLDMLDEHARRVLGLAKAEEKFFSVRSKGQLVEDASKKNTKHELVNSQRGK